MPISLPSSTPPRPAGGPRGGGVARSKFSYFVVLAEMRTGSNLLESNLNEFDAISCRGEVFNPHFIGSQGKSELFGIDLAARDRNPLDLLGAIKAQKTLTGFRYFHNHDPRVCDAFLRDPSCAKIILTRNPLDSYVSLKIARETQQWKLGDVKTKRTAKVRFDPLEFEDHVRRLHAFQLRVLRELQVSGQSAFYLPYEDANDVEVLNGLARWLGVDEKIAKPAGALKRQNPEPLDKKLVNPGALGEGIARLDRFDLGRAPNFEPRRGGMIWAYRACRSLPLVYAPIPGTATAQVCDWMAALDGGPVDALATGFTVQTWRDWQEKTPGRVAFSVLRHPVARAHAVFRDEVLFGNRQNLRSYLERVYQLRLPPAEDLHKMDRDTHRTAFLAYLRFAEAALLGQSGIPVQPLWASQVKILEGFAQQCPLRHVLLESELATELPRLVTRLGGTPPPVPAPAPPEDALSLAAIYTREVESAARAAYGLDYRALGFSDWSAEG